MEAHSDWYNRVVQEINLHKNALNKKDYKKYKLDFLLRLAKRVDESKENRKSYFKTIGNITKHLRKQHKLVTAGYYLGICISIGTGVGIAIGAALGNPGIGPAIGIALGVAVGSYLDRKAKKEGRVI